MQEKSRRTEYDLLRILACSMVVLLHVSAWYWPKLSPNTMQWKVVNFYDSIVRSCVPLFFMISGVFLLKKQISLKQLYQKNIGHLAWVWLVWSTLYAVDTIGFPKIFHSDAQKLFTAIVNGKYHLWFLPVMIGVYLLIPMLYALVCYQNGKWIPYFLILFFLFGILKSTLTVFPYQNHSVFDLLNKLPDFRNYIGYFLLGYALEYCVKKRINSFWLMCGLGISAGAAVLISQMDSLTKNKPTGLMFGYFCLPVMIEAICLFLLFKNIGSQIKWGGNVAIISNLSRNTMGIYLLHPFILERLDRYHINALTGNPLIFVPLVTIVTLCICFAISFILSKIPFIKKCI